MGRAPGASNIRLSRSRSDTGEGSVGGKLSLRHQPPVFPPIEADTQATDSTMTIAVVDHAITLNKRVFVYSPINSFLLINRSMNTSTKGSTTPFSTCDHKNNIHQAFRRDHQDQRSPGGNEKGVEPVKE